MSELFSEYKERLNDEWEDAFDTLVGSGKSPSSVRAAIEYATTIKTQQQAADEWDVSAVAIRQMKPDVIEAGPIEEAESASWSWSKTTKQDYVDELAEELDWEEDDEYRVEHGDSPVLTRKGWRKVHEIIVDDSE